MSVETTEHDLEIEEILWDLNNFAEDENIDDVLADYGY